MSCLLDQLQKVLVGIYTGIILTKDYICVSNDIEKYKLKELDKIQETLKEVMIFIVYNHGISYQRKEICSVYIQLKT